MNLRVLIVDDEAPARAELRYLLERIDGVEVVGEAASAREALALAEHVGYDLVFLDIQMPGGAGGIEAAQRLRSATGAPSVVFVTAHDDRAVQAFAVDAVDYLLKPVREERLVTAVRRVQAIRSGSGGGGQDPIRVPTQDAAGAVVLVDPEDIVFAEADRDHAWVVTLDGARRLSPRSLRELEDLLPEGFLRIHRSSLVNLARVAAVEPTDGGGLCVRMVEPVGVRLDVARRQARSLRAALGLR